ncbi:MAG: GTPase obg [Parcubacteria group bacterium GW2011_GWC1_39_29]|uniref:GTPase Obg n=1 Tax=Candidatus Yanofskybacteria bacterium GW2011_GWD1_39_16 TaxID=1619030 RepID=A0A837HPN5_9BACT|nr:MAG: GTPase obg [Candidatus Yanofskybacteria bacterium GW2011_GWD1_39_16]KKR14674.1 MAG: GTPase obg [Parcubacteria group bacterium GW2011_GWC1_39_29]
MIYDDIMLVDELKIKVVAGKGGDGTVSFNKNKMSLGPTGAKGGNGGSIYLEGISDIGALTRLKSRKSFKAEDGKVGGRQYNDGVTGKDLIIEVPVGTIAINISTKNEIEVTKIGEKVLIAKGGRGGHGNFHFRSSTNTSPKEFQVGTPGEKINYRLELKLIADVGLLGMPNVGKSSLINELTRAKSKVANYAFTTLEPHLGSYYGLIIADIPGIIEGASSGKGLGIKFLKHIERTSVLFHLISAESENPITDYEIMRAELGAYKEELLDKKEYLFISKSDMVKPTDLKKMIAKLKKLNKNILPLSIHDWDSLEAVHKILNGIQIEKTAI